MFERALESVQADLIQVKKISEVLRQENNEYKVSFIFHLSKYLFFN